jgi:hypothetical protein
MAKKTTNPENDQLAILDDDDDLENDPDMCLRHIDTRSAENVDGKPGFVITCHYHLDPDKIDKDTPYDQTHKDEEYIATTKEKALAYFEEQLDKLSGEDYDKDAITGTSPA